MSSHDLTGYELRLVKVSPSFNRLEYFTNSASVARLVRNQIGGADCERIVVLFLDSDDRFIGQSTVAMGGLNVVRVEPRQIFAPAFATHAAQIILGHNHTVPDPSPSASDFKLTARIKECGEILNLHLLDHLIVACRTRKYFSFRDAGLLRSFFLWIMCGLQFF